MSATTPCSLTVHFQKLCAVSDAFIHPRKPRLQRGGHMLPPGKQVASRHRGLVFGTTKTSMIRYEKVWSEELTALFRSVRMLNLAG